MRAFFNALGEERQPFDRPRMVMLAGPNGSGKSTLWHTVIKPKLDGWDFINADEEVRAAVNEMYAMSSVSTSIATAIALHAIDPDQLANLQKASQQYANEERFRRINDPLPRGFVFETVFSDQNGHTLGEIRLARDKHFLTGAVLMNVDNLSALMDRVDRRKSLGEHGVSRSKQLARYPRVLENMRQCLNVAEVVTLVDNSRHDENGRVVPRFVALVVDGKLEASVPDLPAWATSALNGLSGPLLLPYRH